MHELWVNEMKLVNNRIVYKFMVGVDTLWVDIHMHATIITCPTVYKHCTNIQLINNDKIGFL